MSTAIAQKAWEPSVVQVGDTIEGTCVTMGSTCAGTVLAVHGPIKSPDCGGYRYEIEGDHGRRIVYGARWI